jgi:quercetin dioxygenase-like cupin family protein
LLYVFAGSVMAAPPTKIDPLISTDMAWDGQPLGHHVQIVRTVIKAGKTEPVHQHNNLFCGYLEKGELTITKVGGEAAIFIAGDAFCEVLRSDHYGTAGKGSDAQIITFEAIPILANF